LILLGNDKPGIIANVSETLSKYRVNIEAAQTIGREGMFLMELLTDVSQCRIPLPNLMASIEDGMSAMNMKTIFQTEDVFNKKKRAILFEVTSSFVDPALCSEILRQTGLDADAITSAYPSRQVFASLEKAVSHLDGFPAEVMTTIVEGVEISSGTLELMQTLKTMGYKIALVSTALNVLTGHLKAELGLDYSLGVQARIDDDSQTFAGEVTEADCAVVDLERMVAQVAEWEKISADDITVISDAGLASAPGIGLELDLEQLLHLFNQRVITKHNLIGILGSFGVPRS
jgi:phosphoserine phosphatase